MSLIARELEGQIDRVSRFWEGKGTENPSDCLYLFFGDFSFLFFSVG